MSTCPKCDSPDIELSYTEAYGIETQVGFCNECSEDWNEDAREHHVIIREVE